MTQAWYPFYWSDYSGKTMHLTMGQHGAYMLLLRWVYTTGKPIPDKQRFSIARAMLEQECSDVDFVLSEFFTLNNGNWSNDRAFEVIEQQEIKHQRRVNAGKIGGDRKSSNAKAMPEQCSSNQNQNQIGNSNELPPPISPKSRTVTYSPQFEQFWQTYPNRTGKAAAYKAYLSALKSYKDLTHAILIDRAGKFADAHTRAGTPIQYIPHPTTWLNQGRWEDDLSRIRSRSDGTPPAANARGSQFSALVSASAKLMQETGGCSDHGQSGLPEWGMPPYLDIQPASGGFSTVLQSLTSRSDPASGQTIDHDGPDATDG